MTIIVSFPLIDSSFSFSLQSDDVFCSWNSAILLAWTRYFALQITALNTEQIFVGIHLFKVCDKSTLTDISI